MFYNNILREYDINLKGIDIAIYYKQNWFPINKMSEIYFSMHSPNTIHQDLTDEHFISLKTGQYYIIAFNRLKTILLKPPFDTNCINYDMNGNNGYKLRSDCINDCINNELNEKCIEKMIQNLTAYSKLEIFGDRNCLKARINLNNVYVITVEIFNLIFH